VVVRIASPGMFKVATTASAIPIIIKSI
jgi:hypothetical protein